MPSSLYESITFLTALSLSALATNRAVVGEFPGLDPTAVGLITAAVLAGMVYLSAQDIEFHRIFAADS